MSLDIQRRSEEEPVSARKAKQRLYRTENDEVVGEGDPRARFLLCGVGDEIPKGYDVPDHLNAGPDEATPEEAPAEEPVADEGDDDAAAKQEDAPADKAVKKAANK